jgi:hypothetical protein
MDDPDDWKDHRLLYEDGFSRYRQITLVKTGDCLGQIAVLNGQDQWVSVTAAEDFSYSLTEGEKVTIRLSNQSFVYAPVVENGDAGYAYVLLNGKVIGKLPVQFAATVAEQECNKRSFWERLFGGAP